MRSISHSSASLTTSSLTLRGKEKVVWLADQYWIVVENRRWKYLPWPRVMSTFMRICTFQEVRDFVDGLRKEFPDDPYQHTFKVGVTRGDKVIIIH